MADIGIMGGTFDPIHNGHLMLGRQAYQEFQLDQIWFMPSGQPPHKTDRHVTDSVHRGEMVKMAIASDSHFIYSDFEVSRAGKTYTADTVRTIRDAYPEHCFSFIIGADSLYQMEDWYHPEIVLSCVPILVACRAYDRARCDIHDQIRYLTQKYGGDIRLLHSPEIDISSEQLRRMASEGLPLSQYVPEQVEGYIKAHHLYEVTRRG